MNSIIQKDSKHDVVVELKLLIAEDRQRITALEKRVSDLVKENMRLSRSLSTTREKVTVLEKQMLSIRTYGRLTYGQYKQ